MAKKEKINYEDFTLDELRTRLIESKEKLFQLRLQSATAPLKNPHLIGTTRKNIARIHTFIKQKQNKEQKA